MESGVGIFDESTGYPSDAILTNALGCSGYSGQYQHRPSPLFEISRQSRGEGCELAESNSMISQKALSFSCG